MNFAFNTSCILYKSDFCQFEKPDLALPLRLPCQQVNRKCWYTNKVIKSWFLTLSKESLKTFITNQPLQERCSKVSMFLEFQIEHLFKNTSLASSLLMALPLEAEGSQPKSKCPLLYLVPAMPITLQHKSLVHGHCHWHGGQ